MNPASKASISALFAVVLLALSITPVRLISVAQAAVTDSASGIAQADEPLSNEAEEAQQVTVQDVLLEACTAHGYGEDCAKTLLGMVRKESEFNAKAVGDSGLARGYFQIHYKLHKDTLLKAMAAINFKGTTLECAQDLRCSAEWTLNYLKSNYYPKYVNYAVQCHNGCNINNGYAAAVGRYAKKLWPEPIPLDEPTYRMAIVTSKQN